MTAPHQHVDTVRTFAQRFSATRRGARLARLLAAHQLDAVWGVARGTGPYDAVTLVVSELAANAVLHGLVPGRDFGLRMVYDIQPTDGRAAVVVRVEVSDAHPAQPAHLRRAPDEDGGRGLVLVDAVADRWGVRERTGPGKTVWAECAVPSGVRWG